MQNKPKAGKKDAKVKGKDARKDVGANDFNNTNLYACSRLASVLFPLRPFFPAFGFQAYSHFNAAPPSP
jgi:hypothetical protein